LYIFYLNNFFHWKIYFLAILYFSIIILERLAIIFFISFILSLHYFILIYIKKFVNIFTKN
jgi:hypothetical protein